MASVIASRYRVSVAGPVTSPGTGARTGRERSGYTSCDLSRGRGRRHRMLRRGVDPCVEVSLQHCEALVAPGLIYHATPRQSGKQPVERIEAGPSIEQFLRHILGARRLFVTPHAERHELQQCRAVTRSSPFGGPTCCRDDRTYIVAVDDLTSHAVSDRPIGELSAGKLVCRWGRQPVTVIFHHEDHGQFPHCGEVHRLVHVALAGRTFTGERRGNAVRAIQTAGESETVSNGHCGAKMADHADDVIVERAEVERSVPARREPVGTSQQLAKQPIEVDTACGPHARGCDASAAPSRRSSARR